MLIDWFTVGAQVINFLVLVFLLHQFLYKPVLKAIAVREKKISDELSEAAATKEAAQKDKIDFEKKNRDFDRNRAALLTQAQVDASNEKGKLLSEAHQAADLVATQRDLAMKKDERNQFAEIGRRTRQEVFAVARKALADLAGVALEDAMVVAFSAKLKVLEPADREMMAKALQDSGRQAVVRTATNLPSKSRDALTTVIEASFGTDLKLAFQTTPEILGGIELSAGGQKVSWSLEGYLSALETSIEKGQTAGADHGA